MPGGLGGDDRGPPVVPEPTVDERPHHAAGREDERRPAPVDPVGQGAFGGHGHERCRRDDPTEDPRRRTRRHGGDGDVEATLEPPQGVRRVTRLEVDAHAWIPDAEVVEHRGQDALARRDGAVERQSAVDDVGLVARSEAVPSLEDVEGEFGEAGAVRRERHRTGVAVEQPVAQVHFEARDRATQGRGADVALLARPRESEASGEVGEQPQLGERRWFLRHAQDGRANVALHA